jgi:hypothetical protein
VAWRNEGRLHVVVHTADAPMRSEWDQYVRDLMGPPRAAQQRVLVRTYGGVPDGAQRKQLTDALDHNEQLAAILTHKMLARTAATAISWFIPGLKVFGITGFDAACEHLRLSADERERCRRALGDLEHELGLGSCAADEAARSE